MGQLPGVEGALIGSSHGTSRSGLEKWSHRFEVRRAHAVEPNRAVLTGSARG